MSSRLQILKSDIQTEMMAIEHIFAALPSDDTRLTEAKEAIVTGYHLHNLYNAFESIFQLVAEAFENHIPDTSRWHTLLLDRMGRDIEGIRPRLLSEAAIEALDELRRFRHLFRHLYRYNLETEGVRKALKQAQRLQAVYRGDLGQFIDFLDHLNKVEG
jgi:hypothetical protein